MFRRLKKMEARIKELEDKVEALSKRTVSQMTENKTYSQVIDEWINGEAK